MLYARRMMQLNGETIAAFDDTQLEGHVRIGTPDDYADRFCQKSWRVLRDQTRVSSCRSFVNRQSIWTK